MIHWDIPRSQSKRHDDRLSRFRTDDRRVSLYFTVGAHFSKIVPSHGGIWTPSNTWLPRPTLVINPNGSSIGSAVFAVLTSVTYRQTDRPTDHATRSVTIDRIYVRSAGDAV